MVNFYNISPKRKSNLFGNLSVNMILIGINVIFFIIVWILLITGILSQDFFSNNIAISLENIQQLRLWTVFTSMFMHGSFFHLFANMISLIFIGSLVEKLLGKRRYLWFYIISGLAASGIYLLSEIIFPSGLGAVGASGALFGLIGLLILLTPDLPVYIFFIPIPIKMKYAGIGILALLWLISIAGDVAIGNTAHLGGLIAGLAYGIYLRKKYKNKTRYIRKHFS